MAREDVNSKAIIINECQLKYIHVAGAWKKTWKNSQTNLKAITNEQLICLNEKITFVKVIINNLHHYKCIHMPLS